MATLLLAGATMLSQHAAVPNPDVPVAADVRAAKSIASAFAHSARTQRPEVVSISRRQLQGAARVASNGLPRLRVAPRIGGNTLHLDTALRLTERTWLNGRIEVEAAKDGGYPQISARVGALPIPAFAVDAGLGLLHRVIVWRAGSPLPAPRKALRGFITRGDRVVMLVDLPRGLLRALGRAAPDSDPIDLATTDRLYARVMDRFEGRSDVGLGEVYAEMFADARRGDARDHARAAMVAAAMATVGPAARRLAGGGTPQRARYPAVLRVQLAGRQDLAKHFSLSAALAAAADPEIGRALGTWKELDDSLPGGSGFSFVDLAADRAGLRFGQMSTDPARAHRAARIFAEGPVELLPVAALGFREGLSERAFTARYGTIATEDYAAAVRRVDRALDMLPVMRR